MVSSLERFLTVWLGGPQRGAAGLVGYVGHHGGGHGRPVEIEPRAGGEQGKQGFGLAGAAEREGRVEDFPFPWRWRLRARALSPLHGLLAIFRQAHGPQFIFGLCPFVLADPRTGEAETETVDGLGIEAFCLQCVSDGAGHVMTGDVPPFPLRASSTGSGVPSAVPVATAPSSVKIRLPVTHRRP